MVGVLLPGGEVPVPDKVVDEDENCQVVMVSPRSALEDGEVAIPTTGSNEQRVRQRDEGEPPHVTQVDNMRDDPKQGEPEGEPVHEA